MMAKASTSSHDKIIHAAMTVIGRDGWHAATLDAVTRESGVSLADIATHFANRFDILAAFGKRSDVAALKEADAEGGSQAPRDRLFDIIMARFDAMTPYKAGVQALSKATQRDPGLAAFFLVSVAKSMGLIASCAGVDTSGVLGSARVKALCGLYLSVVPIWLRDDNEDASKTMAALDKALARADRWDQQLGRLCKPRKKPAAAAQDQASSD
jgi:ubiquinone biosynthesis protein COQ9